MIAALGAALARAPLVDPEETTMLFGDWLVATWEVDLSTSEGQGFLTRMAQAFNDILFALKGGVNAAAAGRVLARLLKMYRMLDDHRKVAGRKDADANLDVLVEFSAAAAREYAGLGGSSSSRS